MEEFGWLAHKDVYLNVIGWQFVDHSWTINSQDHWMTLDCTKTSPITDLQRRATCLCAGKWPTASCRSGACSWLVVASPYSGMQLWSLVTEGLRQATCIASITWLAAAAATQWLRASGRGSIEFFAAVTSADSDLSSCLFYSPECFCIHPVMKPCTNWMEWLTYHQGPTLSLH